MPLSDGGEGLLDVLREPLRLQWIETEVGDPLGRPIMARYGLSGDRQTGVVEMAEASGLQLLTLAERDPPQDVHLWHRAIAGRCQGAAARAAPSWPSAAAPPTMPASAPRRRWAGAFWTSDGKDRAAGWRSSRKTLRSWCPRRRRSKAWTCLCDVTNPLFGPSGAAWIYGRQKGGSDAVLAELDEGLEASRRAGEGAAGPRRGRPAGRRRCRRVGLWRGGVPGRAAAARHRDRAGHDRLRRGGARGPT